MGFSLKKLGRGIKKIARKNKGGFGRLVKKVGPGLAMAAISGGTAAPLIAKAASAAKTLGKKVRGVETPKSLAPIIKAAQVRVRKTRARMPGGAPMPSMPSIGAPSVGMMSSRPQAKRSLYTSSKPKRKRTKRAATGGAPRKAPSAKQLAARAKFAAAAKARAKARKAA